MYRIGSHNSARNFIGRSFSKNLRYRRQASPNIVHRILTTDHASRSDQNIFRLTTNFLRNSINNFAGVTHSFGASCDIRIFRNHNYCSRRQIGDVLATQNNARPSKSTLCENSGCGASFFGNNKCEIVTRVFYADIGNICTEASR